MSEQSDNTTSTGSPIQPWVDYWTSCVRIANENTKNALGSFGGTADATAWRRQWFDALGDQTDAFLRTPPFLQMMKSHVDALIAAKEKATDSLSERFDKMEAMLRAEIRSLEARVEALEGGASVEGAAGGWDRFLNLLQVPRDAAASTLGASPHEVVYTQGSMRLLRYRNDSVQFAEPVLICFALVNRPYILDLQGDRSVVRQLLARGFDVFLIDWGEPSLDDRTLQLHDYVGRLLNSAVDCICDVAGVPSLNLLGYCMGGTMAAMYTALHQERVRNLILMATPIDFGGEEGLLNLWARKEHFDVDRLIDAYGNCPGEFLQHCFQLMKPVQNFAEKYLTFCDKLDDEAFLENFLAMERWANDSIPVAGETFREYVKLLYQQNRLVKGELRLGEAAVKLDAITCPLLLLVADQDHLVPPSSSLALEQHVGSVEVKSMSIDAGHIGLAVSSKAHRQLWPAATNWIAEHSNASNETQRPRQQRPRQQQPSE